MLSSRPARVNRYRDAERPEPVILPGRSTGVWDVRGKGIAGLSAAALAVAFASALLAAAPAQAKEELPFQILKWTGDFDAMIARRKIRVLVVSNKALYYVDNGAQHGIVYDLFTEWEKQLNRKRRLPIEMVFVPVRRSELLHALVEGLGDVAAADLTETPGRRELVDFTAPLAKGVHEIVVTGPASPSLASIDDLAGKEVFVRPSSSYWETLTALNERFAREGKPAVTLRAAPEELETGDYLEMLNAGLVELVVCDRWKAKLWAQVFDKISAREDLVLADAGNLAFAIRKKSPQLRAALDPFVTKHAVGTLFGNVELKKYVRPDRFVENAHAKADRERFLKLIHFFQRYGDQYEFDWMMLAAQGYQESRLDQDLRSRVGAIGVMQLMPATGKQMSVGDIRQVEANIHAGAKYMRHLMTEYFPDAHFQGANRTLFAFAAYNAGPGRVAQLRKQAEKEGLDPDVWFDNVEAIASRRVGRETVDYVSNIYKYYIAYKLVAERDAERAKAKAAVGR
jgi:membrane-bound lytic murein transglycosylase MltF